MVSTRRGLKRACLVVVVGWCGRACAQVRLPVKLLGDMVVSLDTALRQARERG